MKLFGIIECYIKPLCITILSLSIALLIGTMDGADAGVVKEMQWEYILAGALSV